MPKNDEHRQRIEKEIRELSETADFLAGRLSALLSAVQDGRVAATAFRPPNKDPFADKLGNALEGFSNKRTLFAVAMKARNSGMDEAKVLGMIGRWRERGATTKAPGYYAAAFRDECFSFSSTPDNQQTEIPHGFVTPTGDVWDAKQKQRISRDEFESRYPGELG